MEYRSWRASANALFLSAPDHCPSRSDALHTGVSLRFLQQLAATFPANVAGQLTTGQVVAKYLSRVGVIRGVPRPFTPEPPPSPTPPPHSLPRFLKPSLSFSVTHPTPSQPTPSLPTVPEPQTLPLHDLIPTQWLGPPTHYVVHAWTGKWLSLLHSVTRRLQQSGGDPLETAPGASYKPSSSASSSRSSGPGLPGSAAAAASQAVSGQPGPWPLGAAGGEGGGEVFVWLDVLALPQQVNAAGPGASEAAGLGPPPSLPLALVREALAGCSKGAVLVLDPEVQVLDRAWVGYETWVACFYCAHQHRNAAEPSLLLALPDGLDLTPVTSLLAQCSQGLDLSRMETSRAEDKLRIVAEVKRAMGVKRMQDLVGGSVSQALRSWLKWSGEVQETALFIGVLLQNSELALLHRYLHTVPGVCSDDQALQDIRDIFKVFDTDQTGELELSQFVSALEVSGFAAEEAAAVFDTVDTDGSGTVSKEEFEKWWIQLFELGGASAYLGVDTSYHSLVTNMESYLHLLASFWHREDLAASLRQLLERQQRKWEAGKVKLALAVPPYSLRGSYMEVMDVVVFKISHADYLAGGRLVFRLLQQNLDALALNEAPEHCMVPPEQLSSSMLQQLSLAWWLALLAELLERNPETLRDAHLLAHQANQLSRTGVDSDMFNAGDVWAYTRMARPKHTMAGVGWKTAGRLSIHQRQQLDQREAVVADMVKLKYGRDILMNNSLIAEASLSLSAWMASNRNGGHAPMTPAARMRAESQAAKPVAAPGTQTGRQAAAKGTKQSTEQMAQRYLRQKQVLTKPELPSLSNSKGEAQPGRPGGILNLSRRLGAMVKRLMAAESQRTSRTERMLRAQSSRRSSFERSAESCGSIQGTSSSGAPTSRPTLDPPRTQTPGPRSARSATDTGFASSSAHRHRRSSLVLLLDDTPTAQEEFAQLSRNLDAASGTPTGSTLYQRLQLSRSSCTLTGLEDAVAKLARSSVVPPGTPQGLSHSAEPSPSEPGPRGSWYGEAAVRGGGASPSSAAAAARAALGLAAEEAAEGPSAPRLARLSSCMGASFTSRTARRCSGIGGVGVLRPQPPPTALVDMGGAARRRSSLVLAAGLEQQEWAGVCPSPGGAAASWRPGGQGSPLPQVAGPR
ncbi:hypothetical protein QJQ45_016738 [Haematococcus lacustris]|nr:hypothetical protein QJQ45_016738 [Haematococcus lacustris]